MPVFISLNTSLTGRFSASISSIPTNEKPLSLTSLRITLTAFLLEPIWTTAPRPRNSLKDSLRFISKPSPDATILYTFFPLFWTVVIPTPFHTIGFFSSLKYIKLTIKCPSPLNDSILPSILIGWAYI